MLNLITHNTLDPNFLQLNVHMIPDFCTDIWSMGQDNNENLWITPSPLVCKVSSLLESLKAWNEIFVEQE